ncbi:endonuclease domain-containing protein [Sphingomonas sp. Mn802worker]|uniref:endonuclease domain-containing protein n=1 Tax=Sphingomonas sp. Mn802worker TaxID=629773 RepID=UPI001EE7040E|nr:endonuclease domain-containing protein [Sphingomonas sp. Mn802worker]
MTQPERELWTALRAHRFSGVKFSRQVPIGPFILDFVARLRKLAIEVDGDTHAGNEARDERRTAWLEEQGYDVIRFSNADVMHNLEGVLLAIKEALDAGPSPKPSPRRGEGFR